MAGTIHTENPNGNLHKWNGTLAYNDDQKVTLSSRNLILRGSVVRNTDFIIGVVVYVGKDTKVHYHDTKPVPKFSWRIHRMHKIIFWLILIPTLICVWLTVGSTQFEESANTPVYLQLEKTPKLDFDSFGIEVEEIINENIQYVYRILIRLMHNIALISHVIPMSIYVAIEALRFFQVKQFLNDPELVKKKDSSEKFGGTKNKVTL